MDLSPQPQPDQTALQLRAPALLLEVQALTVADEQSYVAMCERKLAATEFLKKVNAIRDGIKKAQDEARAKALEPWDKIAAPFEQAAELAEEKRNAWRRAQERAAKLENVRRLTAATQQAVAEREETVQALSEAAAATGDPALAAAADRVRESNLVVVPTPVASTVPKVKGIRNTKTLTVTVTSKVALVMALGAMLLLEQEDVLIDPEGLEAVAGLLTPADLDALSVDVSWLKDAYRQRKEAFSFPGITATYE